MHAKKPLNQSGPLNEASQGPKSFWSTRVAAMVAAVVGALLFAESLRFGYVLDDVWIVETDQRLQDPFYFLEVWWQPWWEWGSAKGESRPLTSLSFWAHMQLHGPNPFWPHVVNVLLFSTLCYLVAQLAARWLERPWAAWPVGLLFAAHPLHVEAVTNLVGRAETLSAIFFVLTLLAWHRWRMKITWRRAFVIALLVLLAGLSKETGYLAGIVLAAAEVAQRRRENQKIIAAPWLIPLAVCIAIVAATAFTQRTVVVRTSVKENSTVAPVVNPLVEATPAERWVTPWKLTGRAFSLLLFPYNQSPEYSPQTLMPTKRITDPLVLLGLGAGILWIVSVWYAWRHRLPVLGPLLACAVAWIVPSNTVIMIGTIFGERLLMLLSIFAAMAFVGFLPNQSPPASSGYPVLRIASWSVILTMAVFVPTMLNVASRDFSVLPDQFYMVKLLGKLVVCAVAIFAGAYFFCRRQGTYLPTMALATMTTAFAWTLLCYQPVWRNINYMNSLSAARHPENGHFQAQLALVLVQHLAVAHPSERGRLMQAVQHHAEKAIALYPAQPDPFVALACVWKYQGDDVKAKEYFQFLRSSGYELDRFEQYIQHFELGENSRSLNRRIADLEARHRDNPNDQMLTRKLALAYIATNDRAIAEKAMALFKKIIGTDLTSIRDPVLLDEYAKVLAGNGDGDGVIETYRHLIHVDPTRNDIRINLGVTLIMDGKLAESRRWIDESIDRQPNSFAAWNARGLWFEQSGDFPEAIRATEKSLMLVPADNPRRRIIERRLQELRNKRSR
jgi:tetratricopeptide (TPR) repeat protein